MQVTFGVKKKKKEVSQRKITPVFLSEANGPNTPDWPNNLNRQTADKLELMASTEPLHSGSEA